MNTKAKKFLETVETKEDLINFYESIPDKKWTTEKLHTESYGAYCALGHIGISDSKDETPIINRLRSLLGFSPRVGKSRIMESIAKVNDGQNKKFKQATPKQRILAFLRGTK